MSTSHEVAGLHGVDLNLLLAFDALADARSVTRAAERAGVTQSAMSHTLAKLRRHFDDPLLVRGSGGMDLTPRAEAMRVPVRAALVALRRAMEGAPTFDPASAERTFRLSAPDLFVTLVAPALRARARDDAPGISFTFTSPTATDRAALETGDLDLCVLPEMARVDVGDAPAGHLRRRGLLREGFRAFVAAGGPLGGRKRLSRCAFLDAPHVVVSPRGGGPGLVDAYLEGDERFVAARVASFAVALELVARTDLLLTGPASLRSVADARGDVRHFPVPIELPTHGIAMVWHPRFDQDPAHRWFRDRLVESL